MKVKYVGIKLLSQSQGFPTPEFFSELEKSSGVVFESATAERHFFFDCTTRPGYLLGLVVTLKNQKRFCKAEMQGGDVRLKTEDLLGDDKLVDFNFMAIRTDTCKGVFQYYHNSCSPNIFGDVCKKIFYEKRGFRIRKEYSVLAPGEAEFDNGKAHRKAKNKYKGRPYFAILFDNRNAKQIIQAFREVKELDVTFEAADAPTDAAVAAGQLSETVSLRYKFGITQRVQDIAQAAEQLLSRSGFMRGKAVVVNDFDEERIVDLINCPQDFGQEDFDDLAMRVNNLKASEFQKNNIIDDLVDTLENKHYASVFAQVDKDS